MSDDLRPLEDLRPLIDAARAGDRRALDALAGCVDRFVRLFAGSLSPAMRRAQGSTVDFVLEGLSEAFSRLDGFEYTTDHEFYAWAARHIRHRIIDTGRGESRKKRGGNPAPLGDAAADVAGKDPTASQAASVREARDIAAQALLALQVDHPEEMEAVVLKVYEGLSWPELKDAMGLTSEKRARTLVARGLELLRPRVERALGPGGTGTLLDG
jgi:RNA polymerase sigma factor (sigma-70 family)